MDRQAIMEQVSASHCRALVTAGRAWEKVIVRGLSSPSWPSCSGTRLASHHPFFVAGEAPGLFLDAEARHEASLSKMFLAQDASRPPCLPLAACLRVPKVSMIPLFVGTLEDHRRLHDGGGAPGGLGALGRSSRPAGCANCSARHRAARGCILRRPVSSC